MTRRSTGTCWVPVTKYAVGGLEANVKEQLGTTMRRFGHLGEAITKRNRPVGAKTAASSANILPDTEDSILP